MKMERKYWVIFEKSSTGYSAFVPDLPGCVASGKTRAETQKNIQEAIIFHLEGMALEELPIPMPKSEAEELEISW